MEKLKRQLRGCLYKKISIIELILNKICYNYFISVVFNFIIKNTK